MDILQSQFPEVLEQMDADRNRIAELESLFDAAEAEDYEDEDETGVLTKENVKELKARLKEINVNLKTFKKQQKEFKAALKVLEDANGDAAEINELKGKIKGIESMKKFLRRKAKNNKLIPNLKSTMV